MKDDSIRNGGKTHVKCDFISVWPVQANPENIIKYLKVDSLQLSTSKSQIQTKFKAFSLKKITKETADSVSS